MCTWVQGALQVAGGAVGAMGKYGEGILTQVYNNAQADLDEQQADRILATAEINKHMVQDTAKEQGKILTKAHEKELAQQKAVFAANGLGAGSVTAENIALSSFDKAKLDEEALRYNADMESWGIDVQSKETATNLRTEAALSRVAGKYAKMGGIVNAFSSLLGSASQFSNNFQSQRGITSYGNYTTSYGVSVPSIYRPLR